MEQLGIAAIDGAAVVLNYLSDVITSHPWIALLLAISPCVPALARRSWLLAFVAGVLGFVAFVVMAQNALGGASMWLACFLLSGSLGRQRRSAPPPRDASPAGDPASTPLPRQDLPSVEPKLSDVALWYFEQLGGRWGPVSPQQLAAMVRSRSLHQDDHVFTSPIEGDGVQRRVWQVIGTT